jgi:hypothetical protein
MAASRKRNPARALLLAAAFQILAIQSPLAEDSPPQFSLEGSGGKAEVRIDHPRKRIEVRVLDHQKSDLPKSIGITLRSKDGRERQMELSAIPSKAKNAGYYHGSLPATEESYVGVGLRIPFKRSPPVLLSSP